MNRTSKTSQKSLGLRKGFLNPLQAASSTVDARLNWQKSEVQTRSETTQSHYEIVGIAFSIPREALETYENFNREIIDCNEIYKEKHSLHLKTSKKEILSTAKVALDRVLPGQPKKALLLGVGNCLDIPLQELAEQFDHLTLAELDHKSAANAIKQLSPELQKKIKLVPADITGVACDYCKEIDESIKNSSSINTFIQLAAGITDRITKKTSENTPNLGNDYTFVCSQLVLSQLASIPGLYVRKVVEQKFSVQLSSTPGGFDDKFFTSQQNLILNLQQEHIQYLAKSVAPHGTVHLADTYEKHFRKASLSKS